MNLCGSTISAEVCTDSDRKKIHDQVLAKKSEQSHGTVPGT